MQLKLQKGKTINLSFYKQYLLVCLYLRNAKKSKEKIANWEQEKVDMQEKILQMQNERRDIEKDAHSLMDRIDQLKEELAEGKGDFTGTFNKFLKNTCNISYIM